MGWMMDVIGGVGIFVVGGAVGGSCVGVGASLDVGVAASGSYIMSAACVNNNIRFQPSAQE